MGLNTNTERTVAWTSTIVTCAYVAWTAATQPARVSHFEALFAGLGATLPAATRVVMAASRTPFPLLAGGLVVMALLVKELMIRDKWVATSCNVCAFIVVDGLSRFSDFAMGMPMIDLIRAVK